MNMPLAIRSPDITLQGRALIETEASSLEEPSSSEEESIGYKKLSSELALYSAKLGELLAQLYILNVQKCLRLIIFQKDNLLNFLKEHG